MTTYNIDRITASRLLNVSTRTVDRYLDQGKLSSVKSEGRIWLSKEEILAQVTQPLSTESTSRQRTERLIDKDDIFVDKRVHLSTEPQESRRPNPRESQNNSQELEQIFNNLKEEIAIKDKRLAQASYRIGQLETQLELMVPKLELENQQLKLAETAQRFEEKLQEKELEISHKESEKAQLNAIRIEELGQKDQMIAQLDEELHLERVNKWIYAVILYLLVLGFVAIWVVLKWL